MIKYILIFVAILVAFSIVCEAQRSTKSTKLAEGVKECESDIDIATQEKIVKIVREFMGDPKLIISRIEKEEDYSEDLYNPKIKPNCYRVVTGNEERIYYTVNLNYNIITHFMDFGVEEFKGTPKYSKEECMNIGIDWLNSKGYPLFNNKYKEILYPNEDNGIVRKEYSFMFVNKKNIELKGLDNAGYISVDVNTANGKISSAGFNTNNHKTLSGNPVSESEIIDIVKSFFTEEEIAGSKLEFFASEVHVESVPIFNKDSKDVRSEFKHEERVVITGIAKGVQNNDVGMGMGLSPAGSPTPPIDIPLRNEWTCYFIFDAYNKYLYQVANLLNGSTIPKDVGEKINKYSESVELAPKPDLTEVPYEFLTNEKLKELKPTTEEIETVLFKDNSDRVKFNKESCEIKDLTKFENSSDIWTVSKDNKTYIFREGSPWCLVDNKAVLVSKCELLGK